MKPFENIRIAACLMVHDENRWIQQVLDDLSQYTKYLYVNMNNPTKYVHRVVMTHNNLHKHIITKNITGRWDRGLQRDNTIRMVDFLKPDLVIFIDADEILPPGTTNDLKAFWEDETKITYWSNLLYLWDDRRHIRVDGIFGNDQRVRAFKWQPGINYLPNDENSCPVSFVNLPDETRFYSSEPIIHFGYMRESDREKKYRRRAVALNSSAMGAKLIETPKYIVSHIL